MGGKICVLATRRDRRPLGPLGRRGQPSVVEGPVRAVRRLVEGFQGGSVGDVGRGNCGGDRRPPAAVRAAGRKGSVAAPSRPERKMCYVRRSQFKPFLLDSKCSRVRSTRPLPGGGRRQKAVAIQGLTQGPTRNADPRENHSLMSSVTSRAFSRGVAGVAAGERAARRGGVRYAGAMAETQSPRPWHAKHPLSVLDVDPNSTEASRLRRAQWEVFHHGSDLPDALCHECGGRPSDGNPGCPLGEPNWRLCPFAAGAVSTLKKANRQPRGNGPVLESLRDAVGADDE